MEETAGAGRLVQTRPGRHCPGPQPHSPGSHGQLACRCTKKAPESPGPQDDGTWLVQGGDTARLLHEEVAPQDDYSYEQVSKQDPHLDVQKLPTAPCGPGTRPAEGMPWVEGPSGGWGRLSPLRTPRICSEVSQGPLFPWGPERPTPLCEAKEEAAHWPSGPAVGPRPMLWLRLLDSYRHRGLASSAEGDGRLAPGLVRGRWGLAPGLVLIPDTGVCEERNSSHSSGGCRVPSTHQQAGASTRAVLPRRRPCVSSRVVSTVLSWWMVAGPQGGGADLGLESPPRF